MYQNIFVNRIGLSKNSYMITKKIIREIIPNVNHRILLTDLLPLYDLKIKNNFEFIETVPKYIDIPFNWKNGKHIKKTNNNILGDFGILTTLSEITIPVNLANFNNVRFYGAELYNIYDIIKFRCKKILPLMEMEIGKDYVKDYIERYNQGGGQYLEFHDNPHFHLPLNPESKGYYILGKANENSLRLSAFIIPYYKALYTSEFVIHSDANLIGNWGVVYSKTGDYSTVLLRDEENNNKMTKINFK